MLPSHRNSKVTLLVFFIYISLTSFLYAQEKTSSSTAKTVFQTASEWMPEIDVRADAAIVYGVNGNNHQADVSFEDRVKSWRDRGYKVHFMTGIAWGVYQEYFTGKWDGVWRIREGQVDVKGDSIWHDHLAPYAVPTQPYINYINEKHIKRVIDAGIDHIYLEEPEFWARAGYGDAFKDEWQKYYGFPWRPQHESPANTYLSNKLKYHLYYETLKQVSNYAKEYGKSKGRSIKVFVPTHSLINYSAWQIVSPEASLASLPGIDGYIAQVWTGTSREPIYYNGVKKERVFENAFLEYGSMVSMTAPTGRKMFFLTDPIEDAHRDWSDYKKNYEATFTAQLLYPTCANYEVMPWPERIYTKPYRVKGQKERVLIPKFYSTQMQVMINALNRMPVSDNKVSGTPGIGVLVANSLMFQRYPIHDGYDDPQLSNFYGLVMPLLKKGIPVETVHIENLSYPETLKNTKVLIMTYSNMKPLEEKYHRYLAEWVKKGGVLIYAGEDKDPYQSVPEWWNTGKYHYKTPAQHLFELLGIPDRSANQTAYTVGKGAVFILNKDPKEYVMQKGNDQVFFETVKRAFEQEAHAGKLTTKHAFYLERGEYDIIAVLDENEDSRPFVHKGILIDLYDPKLPVLSEKVVQPGTQSLLLNVGRVKNKQKAQVLASAARVYDEKQEKNGYRFVAKSPINTHNNMRILLPKKPLNIQLTDGKGSKISDYDWSWDERSKTCLVSFENLPDGVYVEVEWE